MHTLKKIINFILTLQFLMGLVVVNSHSQKVVEVEEQKAVEDYIYISETPASFPHGIDSLKALVYQNLKWPMPEFCGEGTVVVHFVVDEKGIPSYYRILRGLHPAFDEEAIRVLKLIKKWNPGKDTAGNVVKMAMNFPIRFRLSP